MGKTWKVEDSLLIWATNHGHLPGDEKELAEAVGPAFGGPQGTLSPYAKKGKGVAYRVVYEGNAAGPYLAELASPEPAQIFCAVSADLKQAWLTATAAEGHAFRRAVGMPVKRPALACLRQAGR
jgi:hypothetical protein